MFKKSITLFLFIATTSTLCMNQKKLLFIDTGFNTEYNFHNLLTLAHNVGFSLVFKPFYHVTTTDINHANTIIITIDGSFLKNYIEARLHNNPLLNPVLQRIIALIETIGQSKNKVISILLPDIGVANEALNTVLLDELYHKFFLANKDNVTIKPALKTFLHELLQPDNLKSCPYNTALLHKRTCKEVLSTPVEIMNDQKEIMVKTVPFFQDTTLATYPLALYIKNTQNNNQFFISKTSLVTFDDIRENFVYNPLNFSLQRTLLSQLHALVYEIYRATLGKSLFAIDIKLALPKYYTKSYQKKLKKYWCRQRNRMTNPDKYRWINQEQLWCGWGGIEPYYQKEQEAVKNLFKSGINMLWLELNPEWYLSTNALKKEEAKTFLSKLEQFNKAFTQIHKTSLKAPHIFIGTDITSNYSSAKVINPTRDVYGTEYSKIPSPLDFENFWQKELLAVFSAFKKSWQTIHHQVTIDGIFLDFEMYHAQTQSGQYTNTMDFSDLAWTRYTFSRNILCLRSLDFNKRINYLLEHNKFDDYFAFLKQEAYSIGRKIKQFFAQEFHHAVLAAYNIHLPNAWFYLGVMAGLSSPDEPIVLATFNNNFYNHYHWLQKHHIYSYHMPVLLFSKFKTLEDFNIINDFSSLHDGIWFNRISRLEEPRDPQKWQWDYGLETSPLTTEEVVKNMSNQIYRSQQWHNSCQ